MAIHELRVRTTGVDVKGISVLHTAQRTIGIPGLEEVRTTKVYRFEGVSEDEIKRLAEVIPDAVGHEFSVNEPLITDAPHLVEVAPNPGAMNPESASMMKVAHALGINPLKTDSSTEYAFYGNVSSADVDRVVNGFLVNKTVERVLYEAPETLVIEGGVGSVNTVPIRGLSKEELMELSRDKLFLNDDEMAVMQRYFENIGRDPTDCELELIAGRWSEHCVHKTFKAIVVVDGVEKPPLYTRIKEEARRHFGKEIISAFVDNSGVMRFYDGWAICGKVETHNSPSAIEPYGGAMTGSGGVFRDILGTGQGAKVLISTDMFCFAPPDMDRAKLPPGSLDPDYLQRRVVAGVRDYGNRMGIPTNNGSVHYHEDFRAKPSVIVGAYGILPEARAQKGVPQVGDKAVAMGGPTGRDGIHGATFSSGEMTDRTINVNSSAVQIGNAIEEKRMSDAILEARDLGLIRAITDCGAAGFSSAIGEMGEGTGVTVDISKAPLKYSGLAPWEIWMSESQERMVLAISPDNIEKFLAVCKKHDVEAAVLGEFDGSNKLTVKYGDKVVADLDYEFLENGLPQRVMTARWEKPQFEERVPELPTDWRDTIKRVMSHWNVCSKEPIVRQYDHTVQGTNVIPPFSGVHSDGPNDAAVITPLLGKPYGLVKAHGMNPILMRIDPKQGTYWAVAEAMANYVAVGGDPKKAALINNYIWPFPDEQSMGSLDIAVDAVVDCMRELDISVPSGKDSLSSTYRGKDGTVIKIPEVLDISVFGKIPNVEKTVTADFKNTGSTLVLVGAVDSGMAGSTYYDINGLVGNEPPKIDLKVLRKVLRGVHKAIKSGEVNACHDVSEGGLAGALAEMGFGGDMGVEINLEKGARPDMTLFNETAGCFVVEVKDEETAKKLFGKLPHKILGKTTLEKQIKVNVGQSELFSIGVDELKQAWQAPLRRIFN